MELSRCLSLFRALREGKPEFNVGFMVDENARNLTTMSFYDLFGDGESEACSPFLIFCKKGIEESGEVLL